jgi:putative ABC transport system permease protein
MKISKVLEVALDFISHHKLGASLAIVAIIISVLVQSFTFSTLQSLESGWIEMIEETGNDWFAIYPKLGPGLLPQELLTIKDKERLKNLTEVEHVAPVLEIPMQLEVGDAASKEAESENATIEVQLVGTNEDFLHVFGYEFQDGEFWDDESVSNESVSNESASNESVSEELPAVLGYMVWNNLNLTIGSEINGSASVPSIISTGMIITVKKELSFEVFGMLKSKGRYTVPYLPVTLLELDNVVLAPYELAKRASSKLNILIYMCSIAPGSSSAEVKEAIENDEELGGRVTIFTQEDFMYAGKMGIESLSVVQSVVAAIMGLIAGISIFVVMMISVSDRTREIGALKAIGARDLDVMAIFFVQALLLAAIGCCLGALLSFSTVYGAKVTIRSYFAFADLAQLVAPMGLFVLVSFLITIASTVYPAYKAASLDPIEALRQE